GDNVTYAKEHAQEFSQIGEAVTLGQLFLYAQRSGAALAADYQGRRTKQSGKEEQRGDKSIELYRPSAVTYCSDRIF
ncbi:MAG: hypothetical protein IJ073_05345, partial [Lachnospiraceae bacterium]|nr:hypothetical protein [Lachnospiraceae bacterium]